MIKFVEVNNSNLDLAIKIQHDIFPGESAIYEYKDILNRNVEYQINYLVYDEDTIIGVTGLYSNEDINVTNSIWLCWFGVLEKYRRKGYGKKVLLKTIEIVEKLSQKYPIKYLRLYTSTSENPESIYLYGKVMDFKENYNNPQDNNYDNTCVIYTKCINSNKQILWDNKFLNIKEMNKNEGRIFAYPKNH